MLIIRQKSFLFLVLILYPPFGNSTTRIVISQHCQNVLPMSLVEKDKVSVILSYIAPACQTAERKANGLDFSLFIMDLFFDTSLYCPWSYGSASNNSVSAF